MAPVAIGDLVNRIAQPARIGGADDAAELFLPSVLPPHLEAEFRQKYKNDPHVRLDDPAAVLLFLQQREAEAKLTPPTPPPVTPLAARLPGAAKAAVGAEVRYPKIHMEDAQKFRRGVPINLSEWETEAFASIDANRKVGDPSVQLLKALVRQMAKEAAHGDEGFLIAAFRFLALLLGVVKDTSRLGIRWLELHGHVYTVGTRVRDGKMIVNGPNAYVLMMRGDVPPEPEVAEPPVAPLVDPAALVLSLMRRMARAAERWAPCFGLMPRPSGWANTSPLRAFRGDDPAPA